MSGTWSLCCSHEGQIRAELLQQEIEKKFSCGNLWEYDLSNQYLVTVAFSLPEQAGEISSRQSKLKLLTRCHQFLAQNP